MSFLRILFYVNSTGLLANGPITFECVAQKLPGMHHWYIRFRYISKMVVVVGHGFWKDVYKSTSLTILGAKLEMKYSYTSTQVYVW